MKLVVILIAAILYMGCTSIPRIDKGSIQMSIELINDGNPEELGRISGFPFLFDTEIIQMKDDILRIWQNLEDSGFLDNNLDVQEIISIDAASHESFGDTMDIEVFFRKYLPPGSVLARVKGDKGSFLVLLGSGQGGGVKIMGLRGI